MAGFTEMMLRRKRTQLPSQHFVFLQMLLVLILTGSAFCQDRSVSAPDSIRIPFETYKLPNGLTVILSLDKSTPTVAVNLWYHVGSKNEQPGRTGFAHLFEHMMFTGSGHAPYGTHDKLTNEVGGSNNATTANDRTNYYETVPSNYLESTLWLESDRMGFLLDTLGLDKLDAQRDVVKNERRQNVDNQPYGRVEEIIPEALYPAINPYSWPVIGSMKDLSAASVDDVKNFFKLYYAPNNAFLAVVGDFDPAPTMTWIAKYFGDLPQGKPVQRPTIAPVTLGSDKRLTLEDRVQVPRLYLVWPTVGAKEEDHFALEVLDSVLGAPRTARLTKPLVYETQAATSVSVSQDTNEDAGEFWITVIPRPGHSLTDIENSIDGIIQRFIREGPTPQEMQKATSGIELVFLRGLESNLGKANRLLEGAVYHGDAGYFRTEYQKVMSVTAADVQRVAEKYLTKPRIALSVVPMGQREQASKPAQSQLVGSSPSTAAGGQP